MKAGDVPIPAGRSILGRVWVTRFGQTVVAISAIVLLGMYVGVIVRSFRKAQRVRPRGGEGRRGTNASERSIVASIVGSVVRTFDYR
jgi:hypothetical protein